METFTKKFLNDLYNGKFGVVFSRAQTRVRQTQKVEGEEVLIQYKDLEDKKLGIQIIFDYSKENYEIRFRGDKYKKLAQKIEKYLKKNNIKKGIIEEI